MGSNPTLSATPLSGVKGTLNVPEVNKPPGRVAEWLKATVLKTVRVMNPREFESRPFRVRNDRECVIIKYYAGCLSAKQS